MPHLTSSNDFRYLVLQIIAELSPCSVPKLFTAAAIRGLQTFGDGSLDNLRELLGQCVQELQVRKLVEIEEDRLVIAPTASAKDEDILDLTTELELCPPKPEQASINQKRLDPDYAEAEPHTGTLQLQAQVKKRAERAPELPKEDFQASAEDEDILDLTTELELCPHELDDATTNQDNVQDEPDTMDGEHAPDPTREEIIAALRKIISED